MTTAFLSGLNSVRFGVLLNELQNAFHVGRNKYLNTLTVAYNLVIKWK